MKLLITSVFAIAASLSPLSADEGCKKDGGCKEKKDNPALTVSFSNEDDDCKKEDDCKKDDGCCKKKKKAA